MKNKQYQAPKISKVKLVINNSILAVCHSSPNLSPRSSGGSCVVTVGCFTPPAGG